MKDSEVQSGVLVEDTKELRSVGAAANACHSEMRRELPRLNVEFILAQTSREKPLDLDELFCTARDPDPHDARSIGTEASQSLDCCVENGDIEFFENALQLGESRSIDVAKKVKCEVHVLGLNGFQVGPCGNKILQNGCDSTEYLIVRDLYSDEASNCSH